MLWVRAILGPTESVIGEDGMTSSNGSLSIVILGSSATKAPIGVVETQSGHVAVIQLANIFA